MVPAFYVLHQAKTPVIAATITLVVNAVLSLLLMGSLQHRGLACAMAVSSTVQFGILLIALRRTVGPLGGRKLLRSACGSLVAAAGMGVVISVAQRWCALDHMMHRVQLVPAVCGLILLGVACYMALLFLVNREEAQHLIHMVWRLRRK